MRRIEKILTDERNKGCDFVVHVQNKTELADLIEVLEKLGFEIQLVPEPMTLKQWMEEVSAETNYDTCFRVRNRADDKNVAYNPSVEHWRQFCGDILEVRDGNLEFNEPCTYTKETVEIEAAKILKALSEGYSVFNDLGFTDKTSKEEIIKWLMPQWFYTDDPNKLVF